MNKEELRAYYRTLRHAIPASRRKEAGEKLLKTIQSLSFERLASFCSMPDEIDTRALNTFFAHQGRLLLPTVNQSGLEYHLVLEPALPTPVSLTRQDLLLVPGLAFDKAHFRIGYGKGHFDRFLAANPAVLTVGIGFQEQLSQELLPRDPWDMPVQKLLLF